MPFDADAQLPLFILLLYYHCHAPLIQESARCEGEGVSLRFAGAMVIAAFVCGNAISTGAAASKKTMLRELICGIVDTAAALNRLPAPFLTRVLWQESAFRTDVTSPAGAVGIAQFMPRTAAERGLVDPYDPGRAITHAARLLAEFVSRFGNLGLAAAAYNAGAARVSKWLHGRSGLPIETQLYVIAVTGHRAEDWRVPPSKTPTLTEPRGCVDFTADRAWLAARHAPVRNSSVRMASWQINLDDFLAKAVQLRYQRPQTVPISDRNRAAESLCNQLRAIGTSCAVYDK